MRGGPTNSYVWLNLERPHPAISLYPHYKVALASSTLYTLDTFIIGMQNLPRRDRHTSLAEPSHSIPANLPSRWPILQPQHVFLRFTIQRIGARRSQWASSKFRNQLLIMFRNRQIATTCLRRSFVALHLHKAEPTLQGLSRWFFAHVAAAPTADLIVSRICLFCSLPFVLSKRLRVEAVLTYRPWLRTSAYHSVLLILWSYSPIAIS